MQGTFSIHLNKVSGYAEECLGMKKNMRTYANTVDSIRDRLTASGFGNIKSTLNAIEETMRGHVSALDDLGDGLEKIVKRYRKTENAILDTRMSGDNLKDALDIVYGILDSGNLTSSSVPYLQMLLSKITGEDIDATILASILNSSINQFAFFADVAENGWKEALKNAIGWSSYYKAEDIEAGKSFMKYLKTALKNEADDFIDFSDEIAKKTSSVAKWAGNVLTVITNAAENYEEHKSGDISEGRAVAETVVEAAVDIGMGIGATAATGAVLAVAGVTAAPAIAVAAGATLVVAGVNGISKAITGKDIGEVIADGVCDLGESIAKWFKYG
ncbi:MAG: hypothetical protein J6A92_07910 [Lachnospiraceae bacterium]|nr:hypothetical protein [Lachnospiraceae bacterium]